MDQQALALAKAIRQAETGGIANPYQAKGASGETGAYQFMPETWKGWSKQYLGQENAPLTVANQNKVAYLRIKELKDQGLKPAQIASAWNSGRADAYKQNFKGTNSKGVAYDVPAYVAKVSQYYKQFKPTEQPQAPKTRFDVAPNREFQLQKAQAEAQTAQKEADKYKGLGFLKEAGKEFVGMVAPGSVGLGKTIQKVFGNQRDTYLQSINTLTKSQANLAKTIREKEARGEDATRMKQIFNQNADQLDELQGQFAQENELPTTGQVAGQIGSTTLDLLTAGTYGKATQGMKAFQRGKSAPTAFTGLTQDARFFSKPTAKAVGAGAGIGYGYDVTQGMMDQEKSPFTPGIGTAVGGGLGIASRVAVAAGRPKSAKINEVVSQAEKELAKLEDNYATFRKFNEFAKDTQGSRNRIVTSDVLVDAVDDTGTIRTKQEGGAVDQYRKATIDEAEGVVRADLEREGSRIPLAQVEKKITDAVNNAKNISAGEKESAIKKVTKELNALKKEYTDGMIPLTRLQDEKVANYAMINFQTPIEVGSYRKALAKAYKELIEESSSLNIKEVNQELAKYLEDIRRLELLDGKKVKGGKLGKYFAQISGNIVGGAAGSVGGPAGSAAGAILGGEISRAISNMLMKNTFKPTSAGVTKSKVLEQAVTRSKSPRLALPAQTTPFKNVRPSGKTIPLSAPKKQSRVPKVSSATGKNITPQTENLLPAGNLPKGFKAPSEGQINLPARAQSTIDRQKPSVVRRSDSQSNRLGNTNTMYNKASEITTNAIDKVSNKPAIKTSEVTNSVKINPKVEPEVVVALKKNSNFEQAMLELEALTEIAEAGSRNFISYGKDKRVEAISSTFPKWIPEELRSKKLMEKTLKHLEEGTIPRKGATKEQKLYSEFVDYIEQRVETPEEKSLRKSSGTSVLKSLKDFFYPNYPNKQGGFIRIGKETPKTVVPKSKVNESVSSLNNSIDLKTKRDVVLTDLTGKKVTVPKDAVIKAGTTKSSNMIVEVDGKQFTVNKNQFQNLKGQSLVAEAKEFAPELKGTEEVVMGGSPKNTFDTVSWKDVSRQGENKNLNGTLGDRKFVIQDEGDGFYVAEVDGKLGQKVRNYTEAVETLNRYLAKENGVTKYSQYTLPNGENYREILIKAPTRENSPYVMVNKKTGETIKEYPNYKEASSDLQSITGDEKFNRMIQPAKPNIGATFKSSHWDEPNVISHLRMNDRTYNGKKLVFMEELQSDWAREARAKGTINPDIKEPTLPEGWRMVTNGDTYQVVNKQGVPVPDKLYGTSGAYGGNRDIAIAKATGDDAFLKSKESGIPNHPLLKNWQETTIKRALMDAVDNDAKYFAWINGDQTSARYNLATYVDDVSWEKRKREYDTSGYKDVALKTKDSGMISLRVEDDGTITYSSKGDLAEKKLDEVLGKGLADKIIEKESGTLAGDGLKFGGEWANNLYDKQVKNIVEDLTGAKVKEFDLGLPVEKASKTVDELAEEMFGTPFDELNSADQKTIRLELEGETTKQLGIELTPEIVARIKGEAPSFSTGKKPALPTKEIIIPSLILFLMTQKDE